MGGGEVLWEVGRCYGRWGGAMAGGEVLWEVGRCYGRWGGAMGGREVLWEVGRCYGWWGGAVIHVGGAVMRDDSIGCACRSCALLCTPHF